MGLQDLPEGKQKMTVSKSFFFTILGVAIFVTFYVTTEYNNYIASYNADMKQELAIKEIKEVLIPELEIEIMKKLDYFAGPEGRTDRILNRLDDRVKEIEIIIKKLEERHE
jgi:hypothetical protein